MATPAWTTNHLGLTGIKLTADNGTTGGYVLPTDLLPAAPGQLLAGTSAGGSGTAVAIGTGLALASGTLSCTYSYTLLPATAAKLGGVKQGTGVTIAADGTISATGTSGVSTFNTRSGAVALILSDVTAVAGTGTAAATSLGLATVAASGSYADLSNKPGIPALTSVLPTPLGTAAVGISTAASRADHVHPLPANLPTANLAQSGATIGQALVWTGLAWGPSTISSSAYTLPVATGSTLGGVKVDGTTVTAAADGTLSIPGVSVTSLLIAPTVSGSDVVPINQSGVDKQATALLIGRAALTGILGMPLVPKSMPLASATSVTLDLSQTNGAQDYYLNTTGNQSTGYSMSGITSAVTLGNPIGATEGQEFNIIGQQGGGGSLAFPSTGSAWMPMDGAPAYTIPAASGAMFMLVCKVVLGKVRFRGQQIG